LALKSIAPYETLFWLHSRWVDEAAFEKHVERPETNQFVERVQRLIDHPFDVTRTRLLKEDVWTA
jgi:quinol monooxygenase YgiN